MSYNSSYYNEEDEGDELGTTTEQTKDATQFKDCILFAVDCSKSMLEENMEGEIPFVVALKSIRSTLLSKIDGRSSDQIGVVLFGTREKENSADKDHVYIMQSLDSPDAVRINELNTLTRNLDVFEEKYGSTEEEFSMADVFWVCSDIMASAPKYATKRIFLITDNDEPTYDNPAFKRAAIQRAKDLAVAGITLSLFGLDRPNRPFDTNVFYKDVASFDQSEESIAPNSTSLQLNQLLEKVVSSQIKSRSEFRVPFQITPKLVVGIRGYNMVIEKKLETPKKFSTSNAQVQEIKSTTRWQCEDTTQYLTPIDINVGYVYGGETVAFTKEEKSTIQIIRSPSLVLLGFKQKQALKTHHQYTHPYFIYPDESQYTGSNDVLLTLIETLAKRQRIAICSFVRRENALPKIVALIPQLENLDANGNRTDPGFQMILLPYANEIRPIPPFVTANPVLTSDREIAKGLIDKLMITEGYDPSNYPNPSIRHQKNIIQSTALDSEEGIEKIADNSVPKYDFIESNLAEDIEKFKTAVGLDNITVDDLNDYPKAKPAPKRKLEDGEVEGEMKRAKEADSIEELWHAGNLKKATNQYLKDFLTTVGIQPKKFKADLVDQVVEYLQAKNKK